MADVAKQVIVVAPHTSNWDFIVGFLVYLAMEMDATWFGKHTLFVGPLGALFRHFGGIPIERSKSTNVVELYVAEFVRRERMLLALAPEGTRSRVPEWKSGFWHIARGAGVPITPAALDFGSKVVRFFPSLAPGDDVAADLATLKAHYTASMARNPAGFWA